MKRLPVAAFVALAIVTAAAFFFIQHLKVSTPLIAGQPSPHPSTINPVSGGICPYPGPHGKPIPTSFREMKISFYLLNRNDDVDVFIVKPRRSGRRHDRHRRRDGRQAAAPSATSSSGTAV